MLNPSVCNDTIRQQTYAQERQQHSESVATSEVGTDGSTQSQSMRVVMEHDSAVYDTPECCKSNNTSWKTVLG